MSEKELSIQLREYIKQYKYGKPIYVVLPLKESPKIVIAADILINTAAIPINANQDTP